MKTVHDAITHIQDSLQSHSIENAAAESRWLAAHILNLTPPELHLCLDRRVTTSEWAALREVTARRKRREPLQHILGDVEFCGCVIEVSPQALIPRPETEWLVETILTILDEPPLCILDIGTGSGAIAIALASQFPGSSVTALDLSPHALEVARKNALRNDVAQRLSLIRADLHHTPLSPGSFDLIVSNPPYIRSSDIAGLEPEVREHEPWVALDGGADGQLCYRSIASHGSELLKPDGMLALELSGHSPDQLVHLFDGPEYGQPTVRLDWADKPRLLTVYRLA
jgi:release factor glutamine methyltransferase